MPAPTADRNCVCHTACLKMDHSMRGYHPEFLLARLQKLQRSEPMTSALESQRFTEVS